MSKICFTSESVTEGHPDKICDQISDAIVDACLAQDPFSKVAAETAVKDNNVYIIGEITSNATFNPESIARQTIKDIGYTDPELGFSADTAEIQIKLSQQSPDIAQGVETEDKNKPIGAGDQGMMFGYATIETDSFMPLPITLAHALTRQLARVRKDGTVPFLMPDGKAQVSVNYENGQPVSISNVVISTQHTKEATDQEIQTAVIQHIIEPVIPENLRHNTTYYINPTGRFVIGGPVGDSGLTGRKIIVDTYGGFARHGGGAYSGKDPTKVDRSAAYAMRQIARSIVESGLAKKCELQVAYAIGVAEPVSLLVETFGTGTVSDQELEKMVRSSFDLSPTGIITSLNLRRPIYRPTAAYGHFGRDEFPWEKSVDLSKENTFSHKHPLSTSQPSSL